MPAQNQFDSTTDHHVYEIVGVALDELGGLGALTQHHQLGLIPALVEASYIIVLREEKGASIREIADRLNVTRGTVESVFNSPDTDAMPRIRYATSEDQEYDRNIAPEWTEMPSTDRVEPDYLVGAAAKFAYSVVQRRQGRTKH